MKIFSAAQVRQWDAYTIAHEPVSSVNLMERAASACFSWLTKNFGRPNTYTVFCGTGNNGGDGLAIARMLLQAGDTVSVFILGGEKSSEDFITNLDRIKTHIKVLQYINTNDFYTIPTGTIVIDALFGSGLNRPLEGLAADLVNHINLACKTIVSIDIPTGLFSDKHSEGNAIIRANHTLGFQSPKLAFLMPENNKYTGTLHLLDIGLHQHFYNDTLTQLNTIDQENITAIYKPRNQFLHKYNFGHALLFAGSKNMMGAAILCARACLRSGAGLVTVFTEEGTQPVLQSSLPEAISSTDKDFEVLSQKKSAIGIGPGIESNDANKDLLNEIISRFTGPLVIDATALQILAADTRILQQRTANPAIITPHTGEFEKLFGKVEGDFERLRLAMQRSAELGCYIVLKGHHTIIACPDGTVFFNTTGNAGMATAGSGDVLTGMLTGLLAQGYSQKNACMLGVWLHGTAGDIAANKMTQESMISGDIIDCIGEAYRTVQEVPS